MGDEEDELKDTYNRLNHCNIHPLKKELLGELLGELKVEIQTFLI